MLRTHSSQDAFLIETEPRVTIIQLDSKPKLTPPTAAPILVVGRVRKLGFFKRLLLSMRQSRRKQAELIIREHRRLEALLGRRED